MKVVSYALTNRDLRHAYLHPVKGELALLPELYAQCPYPQNITMKNLCYFWWAPTLVYQPVYPRSENIRWIFVLKRLGEVVCLSVFIWFCSAQYAAPVLWNSLDKIHHLDLVSITERLLKLSTISLIIWLAGFFAIFQSALNALAEVMRFGDRAFYDDWWNSAGLGDYWRLWNKPVYQFMKRHIFSPMISRGWSLQFASVAVFFVSAILHELLVGIPTKNIIGMFFPFPCTSRRNKSSFRQRRRVHGHDCPDPTDPFHTYLREDERSQWQAHWKLHILGLLHDSRTALRCACLLLRVASQVRFRLQEVGLKPTSPVGIVSFAPISGR